jgi:hypothetical protein
MKSFSNRFKGGLPKGKARPRDTQGDTALFPPSQIGNFTPGPLPPLPSRRLPPIEQPKPSIGSPTPSVASFESEISSLSILSLPPVGDTVTFTTHPAVLLPEVAGEEPTDITVAFDIASRPSPRVNKVFSACETGNGCIGTIKGSSRTTTNGSQRSRETRNLNPRATPQIGNESRTRNQSLSASTKRSLPSTGNGDLSLNKGSSRSRSTGNGNTNYDDTLKIGAFFPTPEPSHPRLIKLRQFKHVTF